MKNICILYNTSSINDTDAEDDDTLISVHDVQTALEDLKYSVTRQELTKDNLQDVTNIKTDLFFSIIEWTGEDWIYGKQVLEILEKNNLKFTGCGSKAYEIDANKKIMKDLLLKNNIATPQIFTVDNYPEGLPVIVKPNFEHCGIGISQASVVTSKHALMTQIQKIITTYHNAPIIEEFIDGPEAHVTVLEHDHSPFVLPPAVFTYKTKDNYWGMMTYEAKWQETSWEAEMAYWNDEILTSATTQKIIDLAAKSFQALGGRSHSRIDMRIRENQPYVLEINHNPGLSWESDSGLYHSAHRAGMTYRDIVQTIVESAL